MNEVLAIVVTYNRKKLLLECIQGLKNQNQPCDILIVDNASTDGTKKYIERELDSRVTYINTGENLGGAGGFNFAMKEAYAKKYKYLWLMDDDTIVHNDTLEAFLNAAISLNYNFGFLSSFGLFTDGQPCKMNLQTPSTKWMEGIKGNNFLINSKKATFVSLFLKKDIIDKVGYPIKEFFIWADDSEYTTRITKQFQSYIVLNSKITHKMQTNVDAGLSSFLSEETDRYQRFYYSFRNRFFIAKRDGFTNVMLYFSRLVAIATITLVKSKKYRFKKAKIVFKGFWDGIFFNPKIEFPNKEGKK